MSHTPLIDASVWQFLTIDRELAAETRGRGCACGGRLHSARYRRKPRCGLPAELRVEYSRRESLCCARAECRRQHDAAGRVVKEIAPDAMRDSTVYDPAGNPIQLVTRRGHTIDMQYDDWNRLVKRITWQFVEPQWSAGIPVHLANSGLPAAFIGPYPMYGSGGGYLIRGDTAVYTYDKAGRLETANNRDAQITRTYYSNGQIQTETQRIRTLAELAEGGNDTTHQYTLTYKYDRNGRRIELQHPVNLAPVVGGVVKDRTRYEYHPFGELSRVTDVLGHDYRYTYDLRTAVDSVLLPRGFHERFTYDSDGYQKTHVMRDGVGGLIRNQTFRYDGRGKQFQSSGVPDTLVVQYSGLGYVVKSDLRTSRSNGAVRYIVHETFTNDPLGNIRTALTTDTTILPDGTKTSGPVPRSHRQEPLTARLRANEFFGRRDTVWYDQAGNTKFTYQPVQLEGLEDRASFYDAEGRLRAADHRNYIGPRYWATFEEYRYDPLGRRVWVRSRRLCSNEANDAAWMLDCRQSLIRRTVWDGERELWEIQMPGQDGSSYMENDTVTVNLPRTPEEQDQHPFYGRVLYTHGLQLDHPLALTRIGYVDFRLGSATRTAWQPFTMIPGWNMRGDPDRQYIAEPGVSTCIGNESTPCVWVDPPIRWWAYGAPSRPMNHWYGTLLERKADRAGTFYRRNRYYDQATGRFTQEDPIGLAGGLNEYGFAAGDPINYSDPFGLKVCFGHNRSVYRQYRAQYDALAKATGEAVGLELELDASGCVEEARQIGDNPAAGEFMKLIESRSTFRAIYKRTGVSEYSKRYRTVRINSFDVGRPYKTRQPDGQCRRGEEQFTSPQILAHEFGHAYAHNNNWAPNEGVAIAFENHYLNAVGNPFRCDY